MEFLSLEPTENVGIKDINRKFKSFSINTTLDDKCCSIVQDIKKRTVSSTKIDLFLETFSSVDSKLFVFIVYCNYRVSRRTLEMVIRYLHEEKNIPVLKNLSTCTRNQICRLIDLVEDNCPDYPTSMISKTSHNLLLMEKMSTYNVEVKYSLNNIVYIVNKVLELDIYTIENFKTKLLLLLKTPKMSYLDELVKIATTDMSQSLEYVNNILYNKTLNQIENFKYFYLFCEKLLDTVDCEGIPYREPKVRLYKDSEALCVQYNRKKKNVVVVVKKVENTQKKLLDEENEEDNEFSDTGTVCSNISEESNFKMDVDFINSDDEIEKDDESSDEEEESTESESVGKLIQ